jgi:hypothetical protein
MKTSGNERNQNMTKPVNWVVVVGISGPNLFGILLYEGQRAVKQMLYGISFCATAKVLVDLRNKASAIPTLDSSPNEIQQDSLQQWNIASSHTPREAVLECKPDMPSQTAACNKYRKQEDHRIPNDYDTHSLRYRQSFRYCRISSKYSIKAKERTEKCIRTLPVGYVQRRQSPEAKIVRESPCSSKWWKWDQIAVAPRVDILMVILITLQFQVSRLFYTTCIRRKPLVDGHFVGRRYGSREEGPTKLAMRNKALTGSIKCHFIGHHSIARTGLTSFLIRINKVSLYRSIKSR